MGMSIESQSQPHSSASKAESMCCQKVYVTACEHKHVGKPTVEFQGLQE